MTDTVENYEALAEAFYADTGVMAPGKDMPAALGDYNAYDLRVKLWQMWGKTRTPLPAAVAPRGVAEVWERCGDCDSCMVGSKCPYALPVIPHASEATFACSACGNSVVVTAVKCDECSVHLPVEVPADA